jgi:hypothetical protein
MEKKQLQVRILDSRSGVPLAASVRVVGGTGHAVVPEAAILRRGTGATYFYCDGEFTLDHCSTLAGRRLASNTVGGAFPSYFSGLLDITVERGTEYVPRRSQIRVTSEKSVELDIPLERWIDLQALGWYPGNTHVHYNEFEDRPDQRLGIDRFAHGLNFTCLSILEKRGLPYASNKYPPGLLKEFSTKLHPIECGEECRHNEGLFSTGYGHVLLLRLKRYVYPVSRGMLAEDRSPDYPPLTDACAEAKKQGGVVVWAHNGRGMEAPVAAALGAVDALNLFDYYWMEPEYDIWYHFLNCGLRLPASTGSDWFICNNNRVYVLTRGEFSRESWWNGLLSGRTFITNGPALFLSISGQTPGDSIKINGAAGLPVKVEWVTHHPIHAVDLIFNGRVIEHREFPEGSREGCFDIDYRPHGSGWFAARCAGTQRDSFDQPIFAHTSPVYVEAKDSTLEGQSSSAHFFLDSVEQSLNWIERRGRFDEEAQRQAVKKLFLQARRYYENLVK